ncbi:hypothetical protein C5B42_05715 [Candidatus Cerribacteria bacterium 'Amazon FNV 2010 28 9']|uniref:Uncharacterized protein n=1 Tax=Candidatus Cerribacteria bacterium 'Amazon FNV 2010 28 9' TaxID=2081795 RepID=A0A317JR81_9BACT|nr:MAG: hypothetical protein C5B42_05715 [Candidatus Cerribacteria bacterium 'Amazon FNV 2010 28 9']
MGREFSRSVFREATLVSTTSLLSLLAFFPQFPFFSTQAHADTTPEDCSEANDAYREEALSFDQIVARSKVFEPDRVYPLFHNDPTLPTDFSNDRGSIFMISELELRAQLRDVVFATDTKWFSDQSGASSSSYIVSQAANLDPALYGKPLHWGVDVVTSDPFEQNTWFHSPVEFIYQGNVDLERFGMSVPVGRLVSKEDVPLSISLNGEQFALFVVFGHMLPSSYSFAPSCLVQVGDRLGDITADEHVGSSTGPHVHMEFFGVPQTLLHSADMDVLGLLSLHQYEERQPFLYIDPDVFLKFLPGSRRTNTGIVDGFWDLTKNKQTLERVYVKLGS